LVNPTNQAIPSGTGSNIRNEGNMLGNPSSQIGKVIGQGVNLNSQLGQTGHEKTAIGQPYPSLSSNYAPLQ
jgi:hypothetical protein